MRQEPVGAWERGAERGCCELAVREEEEEGEETGVSEKASERGPLFWCFALFCQTQNGFPAHVSDQKGEEGHAYDLSDRMKLTL